MEDLWKRAKSFAEEAGKKSQTITQSSSTTFVNLVSETAKKSKEFALETSKKADQLNVSDYVAETAKRSKEFAAEASKKAELLKIAALKQADQIQNIKSISDIIGFGSGSGSEISGAEELLKFGITDDLREFVQGLTSATFQAFPEQDQPAEVSDVTTTASNVRKDLSDWQEKHATLVLTSVKQISKLRYELCPRVMKERRFWRIYFTLVSTHVAPFERKYMEELKTKEKLENEEVKKAPRSGETETVEKNVAIHRTSTISSEQDLDTFLLGDFDDSDDETPDDGDGNLEDDFDKIGNSDVEDEKQSSKATTKSEN